MRLIIAGSRTFNDYALLKSKLSLFLSYTKGDIEIVSGTCAGADKLGEAFARECGYPVARFPADWVKYGKGAGIVRNGQMADYATHCICFWDGKSKGTKSMIELARQKGLNVRVVQY